MAVILLLAYPALEWTLHQAGAPAKLVQMGSVLVAIALGILAYFASAALLRAPDALAREALQRRRQVQIKTPPSAGEG